MEVLEVEISNLRALQIAEMPDVSIVRMFGGQQVPRLYIQLERCLLELILSGIQHQIDVPIHMCASLENHGAESLAWKCIKSDILRSCGAW